MAPARRRRSAPCSTYCIPRATGTNPRLDSRRDSRAIHARLGNLPGDFAYDPHLTGRELVAFLAELRGVRALGRARELAERFRADLDRPMGELSRGNRQKIGLVQAAFHDPELLILDEPSSGLDPLMQEEFLAFVAEERARGHTVFLSSHELDEVQPACDRVAIIRDGELVAVEDVHEITGRTYRHVTLEFADHVDPGELRRLNGVSDLRAQGKRRATRSARRSRWSSSSSANHAPSACARARSSSDRPLGSETTVRPGVPRGSRSSRASHPQAAGRPPSGISHIACGAGSGWHAVRARLASESMLDPLDLHVSWRPQDCPS
jgi:ABC-type multidrug transport system ATPase subunit